MRTTRHETVTVDICVCDHCGRVCRTDITAEDGERFDPRSRTAGFHAMNLWPAHPFHRKELCPSCRASRVYLLLEDIPLAPPDVALVHIVKFIEWDPALHAFMTSVPRPMPDLDDDPHDAFVFAPDGLLAMMLWGGKDVYWRPRSGLVYASTFETLFWDEPCTGIAICASESMDEPPKIVELSAGEQKCDPAPWGPELTRRAAGDFITPLRVHTDLAVRGIDVSIAAETDHWSIDLQRKT